MLGIIREIADMYMYIEHYCPGGSQIRQIYFTIVHHYSSLSYLCTQG